MVKAYTYLSINRYPGHNNRIIYIDDLYYVKVVLSDSDLQYTSVLDSKKSYFEKFFRKNPKKYHQFDLKKEDAEMIMKYDKVYDKFIDFHEIVYKRIKKIYNENESK